MLQKVSVAPISRIQRVAWYADVDGELLEPIRRTGLRASRRSQLHDGQCAKANNEETCPHHDLLFQNEGACPEQGKIIARRRRTIFGIQCGGLAAEFTCAWERRVKSDNRVNTPRRDRAILARRRSHRSWEPGGAGAVLISTCIP